MRILVDGIPRTIGGIGSLLVNITDYCKNIAKDDISFEFIIYEKSGYLEYFDKNNYKYYIAPSLEHIVEYKRFCRHIFLNNNFDYLWFNNTSKVNLILLSSAKKIGNAKIISHPHGVANEEKGIRHELFKILDRINEKAFFRLVDIPFACSKEVADIYYQNNILMKDNVTVITNGIDPEKFKFSVSNRNNIRNILNKDI